MNNLTLDIMSFMLSAITSLTVTLKQNCFTFIYTFSNHSLYFLSHSSLSIFKVEMFFFFCRCHGEEYCHQLLFPPTLPLSPSPTVLLRQVAEPELHRRWGLMSGFGAFSHIYPDEPAGLLLLQTFSLILLLSQALKGVSGCPCSHSNYFRPKCQTLNNINNNITYFVCKTKRHPESWVEPWPFNNRSNSSNCHNKVRGLERTAAWS